MTSEETSKIVDINIERATRKKRATNVMIKEFAKWCFDNEVFDKYLLLQAFVSNVIRIF